MLLTLWVILMLLSLVFLFAGYYFNIIMSDVLIVLGWGFIFILGAIFTFGTIQTITGTIEQVEYTYINNTLISTSTNTTNIYNEYVFDSNNILSKIGNKHTFGVFIMLLGLFGSVFFWYDRHNEVKEE